MGCRNKIGWWTGGKEKESEKNEDMGAARRREGDTE